MALGVWRDRVRITGLVNRTTLLRVRTGRRCPLATALRLFAIGHDHVQHDSQRSSNAVVGGICPRSHSRVSAQQRAGRSEPDRRPGGPGPGRCDVRVDLCAIGKPLVHDRCARSYQCTVRCRHVSAGRQRPARHPFWSPRSVSRASASPTESLPGAALARMEGQIVIGAFVRRAVQWRPAVEPASLRWRRGLVLRGLRTFPVSVSRWS